MRPHIAITLVALIWMTACGGCDAAPGDNSVVIINNADDPDGGPIGLDPAPRADMMGSENDMTRSDSAMPELDMSPSRPDMGEPPQVGDFCRAGWCWVRPTLLGSDLMDVWGAAPNDVWAVGLGGTVLHFDGADWGLVDTDFRADLRTVAGASADDIWAAGRGGAVVHYDGTSWREVVSPTDEHLNDIWVIGPDDVWFAGGRQTLLHWDGATLQVSESQQNVQAFTAFWGSGPDDVWVGGQSNLAKRWNGTTWEWTGGILLGFGSVDAMWGSDANNIFASGGNEVTRWDGTQWNPVNWTDWLNPGTIVGTAADDVWLLGGYNTVHWDGTAFTKAAELEEEFLWGSWLDGVGGGFAVGSSGRIIQLVDGRWEHVSGVTRGVYGGNGDIHARAEDDVWVAARDKMLRFDGTNWQELEPATTDYLQPFSAVWAASPDDAWAAGWGNAPDNIQRWNGTEFVVVPRTDGVDYVNAIWGTAADDVYIVGDDSSILHWNGAELEVAFYNVASIGMYNDVHGSGPSDVWVVGDGGAVMHYDGAAWTPRPIAGADDLGTVLVVAPDDVWAADFWRDHLYRWDGQSWNEVEAPPVGFDVNGNTAILALFGTSDDLWASGSGGNLFHWDGASWSTVANFGVRITSIDASADAFWAAGSSQAVLRKRR